MKWIGIVLLALVGVVVGFVVILFIAMSIFDSPTYAWRVLAYLESDTGDIDRFPARPIANGATQSYLPRGDHGTPYEVTYPHQGELRTTRLDDLLESSGTRAFLIVKDDQLIFETYLDSSRQEMNTSFSAAKSFSSALIGAAIADGFIASVDDPVIHYVPELAGRGLDTLTIRDLLLMNSGIHYRSGDDLSFLMQPFSDDAITYYSPDLRKTALRAEASDTPIGAAFRYNNYHPLLEGLILERATGMPVAEYLQERLWKPMGAAYPASWSMDSAGSGFEKMESGLNAAAVDYARFGLLFLHDGAWNGQQILPAAWVTESTQPLRPDPRLWETMQSWRDVGGYYKYHWWGIDNADGSYDFYAHGKFDQIVYVAPRKNVVIVRLGNAPDPDLQWPLVMQNLVDQLSEE